MTNDELIAWLTTIQNEVLELFHHLQLFKFTRDEILEKNELVKSDSTYFEWVMMSGTTDLALRVARLCDDRRDTESFVRFLRALIANPDYLSRERYMALYQGGLSESLASRHFDNLVGDGSASFPIAEIESDIEILTNKEPFSKITTFRNEYIAHMAKNKGPKPTYEELFSATDLIEKLIIKYKLLLTAASLLGATPTIQGDWQRPLRSPLIAPEN